MLQRRNDCGEFFEVLDGPIVLSNERRKSMMDIVRVASNAFGTLHFLR